MKRNRVIPLLMALLLFAGSSYGGLVDYINRPDDSYCYEIVETMPIAEGTVIKASLTSQTWQGIAWKHWLAIMVPETVTHPDNMILVIAGGNNRETPPGLDGGEVRAAIQVAVATNSAIALITQVPNQPLFNGLREDQIIAYTYDKFLKSEGDDWPLLLPMAKSAVKAMDAVQDIMQNEVNQKVKGFLLTGGSKRGWTSWLAAASGDKRVIAIAPAVIDMLNIEPQMHHQLQAYGSYSNQIDDYTDLQLQERMQSEKGKKLQAMVDPYSYKEKLTMPKLLILGTNDPYWTVDAANFYFSGLPGEKHLIYQPNTGHDISLEGISALSHFFYAIQQGLSYPKISWEKTARDKMVVSWTKQSGQAYLWTAESENRDFRDARWISKPLKAENRVDVTMNAPESGWKAFYIEIRWEGELLFPYGNCTEITVLPDAMPFDANGNK